MSSSAEQLSSSSCSGQSECHTQLLILPDGRVLAHNLTPVMARVLQILVPNDSALAQRALADLAEGSHAGGSTTSPGQNLS